MLVPDKKRLLYLCWLTLFGMSAIGILIIHYWQQRSVESVLLGREPFSVEIGHKKYFLQVVAGLFFGSLSSLLAILLINGKFFSSVRKFFEHLIGDMNPTLPEIIFYSFCAAVGEEVLFRAGLQPVINIWPAAIVFVLLHGYITPYNMNLTFYGIFLVVICAGFGYLFKFFGLFSSITAHFLYDVAMFSLLKYSYQKKTAGG